MKTWCFYDPKTGLFTGERFTGSGKAFKINRGGRSARVGNFDHLAQKIDLRSGKVVDFKPPAPNDDYEWNEERRRWELKQVVAARKEKARATMARIEALEARQSRPVRELALDPQNDEARARIESIETEIKNLRSQL